MTSVVRRARLEDRDVIAQYNVSMAMETEDVKLDGALVREGVSALLADTAKGFYFVVEEGNMIVAQLMITFEWSDWRNAQIWWIQSVYTHPLHRRRGHYKALFQHVQAAARADGAAGVRLYVDEHNKRAQEAYRRLGMTSHYLVFEDMHVTS